MPDHKQPDPETQAQTVTEHAMAPDCMAGQHHTCLRAVSYMAPDGVARTLACSCRCHERAGEPRDRIYFVTWEHEETQKPEGEDKEVSAWLRRDMLTLSKGIAQDWLDGIAHLITTNQVRRLHVWRAKVVEWEEIEVKP